MREVYVVESEDGRVARAWQDIHMYLLTIFWEPPENSGTINVHTKYRINVGRWILFILGFTYVIRKV